MDIGPVFQYTVLLPAQRKGQVPGSTEPLSAPLGSSDPGRPENLGKKGQEDAVRLQFGKGQPLSLVTNYDRNKSLSVRQLGSAPPDSVARNTAQRGYEQQQEQIVRELKERDREVRSHEQAHKSALGRYAAGGIKLQFTTGPDGGKYAIAGEVPVELSEEANPKETVEKMQTIKRAALAPREPSSADRQVAAQASQIEASAQAELRSEEGEIKESSASSTNVNRRSVIERYLETGAASGIGKLEVNTTSAPGKGYSNPRK